MRPLIAPFLALVLAATATAAGRQAAPPAAAGEAVFVVSGRGYGHGVGMSQYGAYGQAKEGRSYAEILSYYYSDTDLTRAATKQVRVLLVEGRRALTIVSTAPFKVVDAAGASVAIPAGPLALTSELILPGGTKPVKGPLMIRPGKAPLSFEGQSYRGSLEVAAQKGFLRVVNHVGLEAYLQGVVPGEMPFSWPLEALKAQAVAARSYALKNLVQGKQFDLYSDVRSQVYGGIAVEQGSTSQAVQSTAGQVVTYAGEIASTLYFSSSGGKTASAEDVFGTAVPYLVSRADPWDRLSPYHKWGPVVIGARTMQSKLGLAGRVLDATSVVSPSGRLRSLVLETAAGRTAVTPAQVRTGLELRSTWVTVGVLRLDRPRGAVEHGSFLRLSGIARKVASPRLAVVAEDGSWVTAGAIQRAPDGSFASDVKPVKTTRYRLEAAASPAKVTGQALLVQVAPRVRLVRPAEPGALSGTVRPRLAGALVQVERQQGSGWARVGQVTTDAGGGFRLLLDLVPGVYRARVPATGDFAEGVSPILDVYP